MKRRITIAPELVEPLQRYGEQFMLSDLTDIVNHSYRCQVTSQVPNATSPTKTVPVSPPANRSYFNFGSAQK